MNDMNKHTDEKRFFNQSAAEWAAQIPPRNFEIASNLIERLGIGTEHAVLDVAAGTGILFSILKEKPVPDYVAIDIAEKMVEEFLKIHPKGDIRCQDFEADFDLGRKFDYVIIFNSIPHLHNLEAVFSNAYHHLKKGGSFVIAHSKTRTGLKEHHKNIGYDPGKEPIPLDAELRELSAKHHLQNVEIQDTDYFFFRCRKQQ
ncbi:MAG: methyltransferase [Bacillota bacterium]